MEFYFCGKYISTDDYEKEVEGTCTQLSRIFEILIIMMDIKSEKTNLKIQIFLLNIGA